MRKAVSYGLVAAMLLLASALVAAPLEADASESSDVLVDFGDGDVVWTSSTSAGTVSDVLSSAAEGLGMNWSVSGGVVTLDGIGPVDIGSASTGGTLTVEGSTGAVVSTSWHAFAWDDGWTEASLDDPAESTAYAVAYLPDGVKPVVDPDHRTAWTSARGDSSNTGSTDEDVSLDGSYSTAWSVPGVSHATTLYAKGLVIQKFGIDQSTGYADLCAIDIATGEVKWSFKFLSGANYESSTPVIVGDYVYFGTMTSYLYRIPLVEGPGEGNCNVTSIGGVPYQDAKPVDKVITRFSSGTTYDSAFSSIVVNSGALYMTHSNGMVYCFDLDLNLVWSKMLGASTYLLAPTVAGGHVFTGAFDGHLYILDQCTGEEEANESVYQVAYRNKSYGGLGQIAAIENRTGTFSLIFSVSDGLGMSQQNSGMAVYEYDPASNSLIKRLLSNEVGIVGKYVTPVSTEGFTGAYFMSSDGLETSLNRVGTDGSIETLVGGLAEIHSPGLKVDGGRIVFVSYNAADPIYVISLDGEILGAMKCDPNVRNFNMVPAAVFDGSLVLGNDAGLYRVDGGFPEYVVHVPEKGQPVVAVILEIIAAVLAVLLLVYAVLRYGKHIDKPFAYLSGRFKHYLYGEDFTHNTRNKHRLKFVLIVGAVMVFLSFTLCLCCGANGVINPVEAYSHMFSAISKGGTGLDTLETSIYSSRLPRALAAFAVGIGLSIAGCIYQAIIRNPLVDPYIMGVSSGAAIAAIAVIAFDFTFFGLFSSHSIFLTAVCAMIGGIIAFACTMFLAEKSGGSSINYVLAGVVVGLALSAVQTLMLTMAGHKLSNALTWLYGSFAEISWAQLAVIFVLAIALSVVPLMWAKEFNLVLLGEDQAKQMGLDVKKFTRFMLILASVLTSVCVAFVGVIGFVGLVIPHLCRMLLGSDHRMVMPASICFGGVMLMLADLLARTGYYGMELPVGAITTIIGVPVFAYLLIKKGRLYDG